MAKGKKTGGRKIGSKNKISKDADDLFERLEFCPLEELVKFAKGDWEGLGYDSSVYVKEGEKGQTSIGYTISPELRVAALKEACKYRFAPKKVVDLKSSDGSIKIIVEDYGKK